MAKTSDARRRARRRHHAAQSQGDVFRVSAPSARLPELFRVLTDVVTAADKSMQRTELTDRQLSTFDLAIFVRGTNALKSARVLLEHAHWEAAAMLVRQLFELLVNMEYLADRPDRRAAALDYARFGLLQKLQAERRRLEYEQQTGRSVDSGRLSQIQQWLKAGFADMQVRPRADGTLRWQTSWNRKTVKDLAAASPSRLRVTQYEQLYSTWSEQSHAAPGALLDAMFATAHPDWVADTVKEDDVRVIETANMAIFLFVELWRILPYVRPLGPGEALDWVTRAARLFGDQAPAWSNTAHGAS